MGNKKRQHTVQKAYLERWVVEDNFFVYDLENQAIHRADPKTQLRKSHIYTLPQLGEEDKLFFDDLITDIEKQGFPLLSKLEAEPISEDEKYLLSQYIALQLVRTPQMKKHMHDIQVKLIKENTIDLFEDPERKADFLRSIDSKYIDIVDKILFSPRNKIESIFRDNVDIRIENMKEIWIAAILELMGDITQITANSEWILLRADARRSFIVSDNPVVTISPIDENKKHLYTEVTFPISPKVMLYMKRNSFDARNRIGRSNSYESHASVRELNTRTIMHADRYIYSHSPQLLERMVKIGYKYWISFKSSELHVTENGLMRIPDHSLIQKGVLHDRS